MCVQSALLMGFSVTRDVVTSIKQHEAQPSAVCIGARDHTPSAVSPVMHDFIVTLKLWTSAAGYSYVSSVGAKLSSARLPVLTHVSTCENDKKCAFCVLACFFQATYFASIR